MKNFAIYVISFDGYYDLWDIFFDIFDKFWGNCSYPIYLVNNEIEYYHQNITVLHTGIETHWFDRALKSLKMVQEQYILFLMEDYFISKIVNETDIQNIIKLMETENIYFYRLSEHSLGKNKNINQKVPKGVKYPISLQPAIWKKSELISILEEIKGTTPWDFEYYFDNKKDNANGYFDGILYDNRDILGYKNAVLRGKWIPRTLKYYQSLGIDIDTSKRGILSNMAYSKFIIADFAGRILPNCIRTPIKKIFKYLEINYI